MKPKILLGLPTMSSVHTFTAVVIMAWISEAHRSGKYNLSVYPTMSVSPVDEARNEIVKQFLDSDCTHLLFVDADTIPPTDALEKLLAHDKDIVSAITPIIDINPTTQEFYRVWNCWGMDDKRVKPKSGMQPIKGAGSSCILIKREVFEKMEKPYYRFVYQDDTGKDVGQIGEDVRFIAKAVGLGYEVWADTDIICKHYKSTIW